MSMSEKNVSDLFVKMISKPLGHIEAAHLRAEYYSMRHSLDAIQRAYDIAMKHIADAQSQDFRIESSGLVTRVWVRGVEIKGIREISFSQTLEGLPELSLDLVPAPTAREEPKP